MHASNILAAVALIQGALSAKISTFSGRDCTGTQTDIHVYDDTAVDSIPKFESYRENGWGTHGQRVGFYTDVKYAGTCQGPIYDTWAYDGDYFHSHQCYNLSDHPDANAIYATCVQSSFDFL